MSDAELDDDLLALAGDDGEVASEGEATEPQSHSGKSPAAAPAKSQSPAIHSPPPHRQDTPKSPSPPPRQSIEQPLSASASAPKSQQQTAARVNDAPPSPASSDDSLGSGAMSESESDDDEKKQPTPQPPAHAGDDDSGFPLEGKFYSQRDKEEIMAMSEIKREEILAERAQEAEQKNQALALRRMFQAREKEEAQRAEKNKRKATAADLDDSPRKSSRAKTKANESLEAYKRQREQRNKDRRQGEDVKAPKKKSPSLDKDGSSGEASDVDWDDRREKSTAPKADQEPTLVDFNHIRVGRSNFATVIYRPAFEETMAGCFARVCVSPGTYKMGQIKAIVNGKSYAMENSSGKPFTADQYATVAHGTTEKTYPFTMCSDSKLTEAEFVNYKQTCADDGVRLPNLATINAKLRAIHELLEQRMTDSAINAKIKRSGVHDIKYASITINNLRTMIEQAERDGDEAKVAEYQKEIAALERKANIFGAKASTPTNGNLTSQPKAKDMGDRLDEINRANRIANTKNVREALIREKNARRIAGQLSRAGTPATGSKTGTPTGSRSGTPLPPSLKKPNAAGFRSRNYDDEIMANMDLGIDIDI